MRDNGWANLAAGDDDEIDDELDEIVARDSYPREGVSEVPHLLPKEGKGRGSESAGGKNIRVRLTRKIPALDDDLVVGSSSIVAQGERIEAPGSC